MTVDRPYPLKMRVLEAMIHAENNYVHPDQVQVAIDLIRAEVLEEAAMELDRRGFKELADTAIRALNGAP